MFLLLTVFFPGATNYVAPPTASTPHYVHGQFQQFHSYQPPTMMNPSPPASEPFHPTTVSQPRNVTIPYPNPPPPLPQQTPVFPNSSPWTGAFMQ